MWRFFSNLFDLGRTFYNYSCPNLPTGKVLSSRRLSRPLSTSYAEDTIFSKYNSNSLYLLIFQEGCSHSVATLISALFVVCQVFVYFPPRVEVTSTGHPGHNFNFSYSSSENQAYSHRVINVIHWSPIPHKYHSIFDSLHRLRPVTIPICSSPSLTVFKYIYHCDHFEQERCTPYGDLDNNISIPFLLFQRLSKPWPTRSCLIDSLMQYYATGLRC